MIKLNDKKECCGCSACEQVCPVHAIKMVPDEEGFLYPITDTNVCVECHLCERTCPIKNTESVSQELDKVYICQNKYKDIRKESTSGGFFTVLAKYVLAQNGVVFGAAYDNELNVIHDYAEDEKALARFRGSKYAQSNLQRSFSTIKNLLKDNRWVLFTGTPCQTEGLIKYLNKQYERLIIMDIACYGVASPLAYKSYIDNFLQSKKLDKTEISTIKFRDKSKYGYEYSQFSVYDKSGKRIMASGAESCRLLRGFVANDITRPACYDCCFKKKHRISDFTVWDCFNVYKYSREMDDNIGTSHVMVHSQKGNEIFHEIKNDLVWKSVDSELAIGSEPSLTVSSVPGKNRNSFLKELNSANNPKTWKKFYPDSVKVKTERMLRKTLSRLGLYGRIKRFIKDKKGGSKKFNRGR